MNENLKTKAATWMGGPNGADPFSIEKKKKKKNPATSYRGIESAQRAGSIFLLPNPPQDESMKNVPPPSVGGVNVSSPWQRPDLVRLSAS